MQSAPISTIPARAPLDTPILAKVLRKVVLGVWHHKNVANGVCRSIFKDVFEKQREMMSFQVA